MMFNASKYITWEVATRSLSMGSWTVGERCCVGYRVYVGCKLVSLVGHNMLCRDTEYNMLCRDTEYYMLCRDAEYYMLCRDAEHNMLCRDTGHNMLCRQTVHNMLCRQTGHNMFWKEGGIHHKDTVIKANIAIYRRTGLKLTLKLYWGDCIRYVS